VSASLYRAVPRLDGRASYAQGVRTHTAFAIAALLPRVLVAAQNSSVLPRVQFALAFGWGQSPAMSAELRSR